MLLEFRVKNFKCFRDEQVFSMVASSKNELLDITAISTDTKDVPYVLSTGVIYSPNAGGKTTLLEAMNVFIDIIKNSDKWGFDKKLPVRPFLFSKDSLLSPTEFEASILVDGRRYQYGYVCTNKRIIEEYLYEYPDGNQSEVFHRSYDSGEAVCTWGASQDYKKKYQDMQILENNLLLSVISTTDNPTLFRIRKFFEEIDVIFSDKIDDYYNHVIEEFSRNDSLKKHVIEILNRMDIIISDIEICQENGQHIALFSHESKTDSAILSKKSESKGTILLIVYLFYILKSITSGGVLCIDDLGMNLHPLLLRNILHFFRSSEEYHNHRQLIFTSHNVELLKEIDKSICRDQIWFIENDSSRSTHLYSLVEFKKVANENHLLGYLHGRYGAVPLFRDFL